MMKTLLGQHLLPLENDIVHDMKFVRKQDHRKRRPLTAVIAVIKGAAIVRVHDVRETVDALRVAAAVTERDGDR